MLMFIPYVFVVVVAVYDYMVSSQMLVKSKETECGDKILGKFILIR